ncbi:MAG: hypothetical protein JKY89_10825 [Immundisolibacteraceae bacterium]|nr:hypothetical protein [Immundisolibacteraceae bacterium]
MIDLTYAEVGDEFVDSGGIVHSIVIMGSLDVVTIGKYPAGDYHETFKRCDGSFVERDCGSRPYLVSKIDPRPWLEYLPDADLFTDDTVYIECNMAGYWFIHNANTGHKSPIKLPTLTGDQWKLSKISIVELKEWQATNK